MLEIKRLEGRGSHIVGYNEIAKVTHIGFEPKTGFAFHFAFHHTGGKGREFVILQFTKNQLFGFKANDQGDTELPSAVRGIGTLPWLDGVDWRDITAVFLVAMDEKVVIVDHACGHVNLIVATANTEGPAD